LVGGWKVLVNPEYIDVDRLRYVLDQWGVLVAPEPDPIGEPLLRITSMCGTTRRPATRSTARH
jgi:glycine amidinotransferase